MTAFPTGLSYPPPLELQLLERQRAKLMFLPSQMHRCRGLYRLEPWQRVVLLFLSPGGMQRPRNIPLIIWILFQIQIGFGILSPRIIGNRCIFSCCTPDSFRGVISARIIDNLCIFPCCTPGWFGGVNLSKEPTQVLYTQGNIKPWILTTTTLHLSVLETSCFSLSHYIFALSLTNFISVFRH